MLLLILEQWGPLVDLDGHLVGINYAIVFSLRR